MPKLPRDISGMDLVRSPGELGYRVVRRSGSHVRLECSKGHEMHHITIPAHASLKVGTLHGILSEVALFKGSSLDELNRILFG
jgi:predicted RNA binding protein YcfA (HicA-like mRNA interferase family)